MAVKQRPLDVYGEVIDAVSYSCREGGRIDRETQAMLRGFGDFVCRHWQEPDEAIWEATCPGRTPSSPRATAQSGGKRRR